jgi:hypothetical protein
MFPGRIAVPDDELVAGVEEPPGDAASYCAEPDNGDLRH